MSPNATPQYGMALSKAIGVQAIDSYTYTATVSADYCYTSALSDPTAHGGYVASIVLNAIGLHFRSTLSKYNQPDTFTFHAEYPYASNAGQITIKLTTVKLGKGFSTIQFTATQKNQSKLVGYATNFNASLRKDKGFAYSLASPLEPYLPFPISFSKLADGEDPNWIVHSNLWTSKDTRKSTTQAQFALPRAGQIKGNYLDEWITPAQPGECFTNESLGWVCDQWPQGIPQYRPAGGDGDLSDDAQRARYGLMSTPRGIWKGPSWYPTMMMDIEIKKHLPPEGVTWLFVRAVAKQIKDGRMDLEVLVCDAGMELVALSHHVCLVIELGGGKKGKDVASGKEGSKL